MSDKIYEFLARFNKNGDLSGSHVKRHVPLYDSSGVVVDHKIGLAESVALGSQELADFLTQEQSDLLAQMDILLDTNFKLGQERDAANQENHQLATENQQLKAKIVNLEASVSG